MSPKIVTPRSSVARRRNPTQETAISIRSLARFRWRAPEQEGELAAVERGQGSTFRTASATERIQMSVKKRSAPMRAPLASVRPMSIGPESSEVLALPEKARTIPRAWATKATLVCWKAATRAAPGDRRSGRENWLKPARPTPCRSGE